MVRPDPRLTPKSSWYGPFGSPYSGGRRSTSSFGMPLAIYAGLIVLVAGLWELARALL